jgi:hypothetical protein
MVRCTYLLVRGLAMTKPPSIGRVTPVIHRPSSHARKSAAHAASQAVPSACRALAIRRASRSGSSRAPIGA